jgi:transposase
MNREEGSRPMSEVTMIGVDLAKSVFQVHSVDASGRTVIRRLLKSSQVLPFFERLRPSFVGTEACATSVRFSETAA